MAYSPSRTMFRTLYCKTETNPRLQKYLDQKSFDAFSLRNQKFRKTELSYQPRKSNVDFIVKKKLKFFREKREKKAEDEENEKFRRIIERRKDLKGIMNTNPMILQDGKLRIQQNFDKFKKFFYRKNLQNLPYRMKYISPNTSRSSDYVKKPKKGKKIYGDEKSQINTQLQTTPRAFIKKFKKSRKKKFEGGKFRTKTKFDKIEDFPNMFDLYTTKIGNFFEKKNTEKNFKKLRGEFRRVNEKFNRHITKYKYSNYEENAQKSSFQFRSNILKKIKNGNKLKRRRKKGHRRFQSVDLSRKKRWIHPKGKFGKSMYFDRNGNYYYVFE